MEKAAPILFVMEMYLSHQRIPVAYIEDMPIPIAAENTLNNDFEMVLRVLSNWTR